MPHQPTHMRHDHANRWVGGWAHATYLRLSKSAWLARTHRHLLTRRHLLPQRSAPAAPEGTKQCIPPRSECTLHFALSHMVAIYVQKSLFLFSLFVFCKIELRQKCKYWLAVLLARHHRFRYLYPARRETLVLCAEMSWLKVFSRVDMGCSPSTASTAGGPRYKLTDSLGLKPRHSPAVGASSNSSATSAARSGGGSKPKPARTRKDLLHLGPRSPTSNSSCQPYPFAHTSMESTRQIAANRAAAEQASPHSVRPSRSSPASRRARPTRQQGGAPRSPAGCQGVATAPSAPLTPVRAQSEAGAPLGSPPVPQKQQGQVEEPRTPGMDSERRMTTQRLTRQLRSSQERRFTAPSPPATPIPPMNLTPSRGAVTRQKAAQPVITPQPAGLPHTRDSRWAFAVQSRDNRYVQSMPLSPPAGASPSSKERRFVERVEHMLKMDRGRYTSAEGLRGFGGAPPATARASPRARSHRRSQLRRRSLPGSDCTPVCARVCVNTGVL
jgi:hypothetical protein